MPCCLHYGLHKSSAEGEAVSRSKSWKSRAGRQFHGKRTETSTTDDKGDDKGGPSSVRALGVPIYAGYCGCSRLIALETVTETSFPATS